MERLHGRAANGAAKLIYNLPMDMPHTDALKTVNWQTISFKYKNCYSCFIGLVTIIYHLLYVTAYLPEKH